VGENNFERIFVAHVSTRYHAQRDIDMVFLSVRPSVRPIIASKRLYISQNFSHHLTDPSF